MTRAVIDVGRVKVINLDDLEKLQITFLTASSSVETESVGENQSAQKKVPSLQLKFQKEKGATCAEYPELPQSTCTRCITQ